MPTTTNNGWTTPADSDPFKDGALAIRTLGNGIDTSVGTGLLAWTAYTPTLTNVTLGTGGSSSFFFCKIGKTVHVRGTISIAGAGTVGASGFVDFSPPVTPVGYTFLAPIGLAQCYNGSVIFNGQVLFISTTNLRITVRNVAGTYSTAADVSATVPFAWNTGATRQMFVSMTYQAA